MGPNPFHSAPAVHSHKNCAYCHRFQRCEFKRLQQCGRCHVVFYCSKECQKIHWPEHKIACKSTVTLDKHIEAKTGIPHGYIDFVQWVEYYSTPMKNCMVAALNLPQYPHQERDSALVIHIVHKGDATLPLQHRFTIDTISRHNRGENGSTSMEIVRRLDSEETKKLIEFGKKENGSDYYGTLMFMVNAVFSESPMVSVPILKYFSITKHVASARVISGPWWPPLRHILENGKKMKFCCGKIEGVGCCCGGWVHEDEMKGNPWR